MNAQKDLDVDVATPSVIGAVFVLLFVPILVLWGVYIKQGQPEPFRLLLLPLTLCALIVGTDAVNQSLSALMSAPMAITTVQAGALAVITGCWSLGCEVLVPVLVKREGVSRQLLKWGAVAILFTVYQLVNHLVSYWCTLCERTVFANLCPVLTLFLEMTLMPSQIRPEVSFLKKASLATMLLGAVMFCIQYADFSRAGVAVSLLMVGLTIPYRIVQRWLLVECSSLTIGVMACYDGLLLTIPSSLAFSARAGLRSWVRWGAWLSSPSICLMLVLSLLTFSANHCVSLAMLRSGSATNYLVMHNVSNILVVCMGIMFFHDNVRSSPVMIVGISMSLLGGIAYALETSIAGSSRCWGEPRKLVGKS